MMIDIQEEKRVCDCGEELILASKEELFEMWCCGKCRAVYAYLTPQQKAEVDRVLSLMGKHKYGV